MNDPDYYIKINDKLREELDCRTDERNALRKQCDELREELDCRTGERNALHKECTRLRLENDDLNQRLKTVMKIVEIDNDQIEMEQGLHRLEKEIEKL